MEGQQGGQQGGQHGGQSLPTIQTNDPEGVEIKNGAEEEKPKGNSSGTGEQKQAKKKDWLAVGGIHIEKRRRSSASNYRIQDNKVVMESETGEMQSFEIVHSREKYGVFRKAVPVMPVAVAVICLILNLVPGLGTFVSTFSIMCGCPTCGYETKRQGIVWNLLAAILQVILAPLIIGWIWSIQHGGLMVQEALKKKIDERETKEEQLVAEETNPV